MPDQQVAQSETLEQIADRIARDWFPEHGLSTNRMALSNDILSALRNERERAFDQGYVCAVANIMTLHGEDVIAREVLNQNRPKDWSNIDKADMVALQPIFDHEAALAEIGL